VQPSSLPESDPTASEVRTRSGRVSKPPVRYEPVEQVEDDYSAEDYDTEIDDDSDISDSDDEEDFDDDDEDADEDGNLDGFVVPDKSESDEEDNGRPIPPTVPVVKKRRA
jgi:hypothetical protein